MKFQRTAIAPASEMEWVSASDSELALVLGSALASDSELAMALA